MEAERYTQSNLLGAGVLGDCLGSLTDSVLCKLSWEEKPDGGLHLPAGDGGALVVVSKTRCFGGDSLEDVVDEAVHDAHGLAGNSSVRVHLLEDFVDVDCVTLLPPALLLLISLGDVLLGLSGLLGGFSTRLGRHDSGYYTPSIPMKDPRSKIFQPGPGYM